LPDAGPRGVRAWLPSSSPTLRDVVDRGRLVLAPEVADGPVASIGLQALSLVLRPLPLGHPRQDDSPLARQRLHLLVRRHPHVGGESNTAGHWSSIHIVRPAPLAIAMLYASSIPSTNRCSPATGDGQDRPA